MSGWRRSCGRRWSTNSRRLRFVAFLRPQLFDSAKTSYRRTSLTVCAVSLTQCLAAAGVFEADRPACATQPQADRRFRGPALLPLAQNKAAREVRSDRVSCRRYCNIIAAQCLLTSGAGRVLLFSRLKRGEGFPATSARQPSPSYGDSPSLRAI